MLAMAKEERAKRLVAMAAKVPPGDAGRQTLRERVADVCVLFEGDPPAFGRRAFLASLWGAIAGDAADGEPAAPPGAPTAVRGGYTQTIQQLPGDVVAAGVSWLQQVVDSLCEQAAELLQPLHLFQEQ
jgi:hypothetical protein